MERCGGGNGRREMLIADQAPAGELVLATNSEPEYYSKLALKYSDAFFRVKD